MLSDEQKKKLLQAQDSVMEVLDTLPEGKYKSLLISKVSILAQSCMTVASLIEKKAKIDRMRRIESRR